MATTNEAEATIAMAGGLSANGRILPGEARLRKITQLADEVANAKLNELWPCVARLYDEISQLGWQSPEGLAEIKLQPDLVEQPKAGRPSSCAHSQEIFRNRRERNEPLGRTCMTEAGAIWSEWPKGRKRPQVKTISGHIRELWKTEKHRADKSADKL